MNIRLYVLFILLTVGRIWSNTLPSVEQVLPFMSTSQIDILKSKGEYTKFHGEEFKPSLIPNCELKDIIIANYKNININLGIEGLFLYKDISSIDVYNNLDTYLLDFFNIFSSVSTLQGIEYYSESRKKMRTLFKESWLIDGLDTQVKLTDPQFSILDGDKTLFAHQNDSTFGSSLSKIKLSEASDSVGMTINNKTDLWYYIVKVIKKDNMIIDLVVVPTSDGILYYGITAADTINVKVFQDHASKSFYNRVVSFNHWFINSFTGLRKK